MMDKHVIIVGAGFSGAVAARIFARANYKVDIYEKRGSIGGNMYDFKDEDGIIVQKYGPHIFHTSNKDVLDFLSSYTLWNDYKHQVKGYIDGKLVPIPFNLESLELLFSKEDSKYIKEFLVNKFGMNKRIPIMELMKEKDEKIIDFAKYVYEKVFRNYTLKQWGLSPERLGENVMARVPVNISYDNYYFSDEYQLMPKDGFTALFENMINRKNITIHLDSDATSLIKFDDKKKRIIFKGKPTRDIIIYTGCLDELFGYCYGELQYRTLDFMFELKNSKSYQDVAVVNYPNEERYTRITEFTKFTSNPLDKKTIIMKEFPRSCSKDDIPYYPIEIKENTDIYNKYLELSKDYKNLYPLGRLAQYKYMNMDICINNAILLAEQLVKSNR